jgi:hypothetical protein
MNCATQAFVGTATANIGDVRVNIRVCRMGMVLQEGDRGHDLAGLAVSALRDIFGQPCPLHRMAAIR